MTSEEFTSSTLKKPLASTCNRFIFSNLETLSRSWCSGFICEWHLEIGPWFANVIFDIANKKKNEIRKKILDI